VDSIKAAITGIRNGRPAPGGYIYRGTGHDIMPWAVTDDDSPAGVPGGRKRRSDSVNTHWCYRCASDKRSRAHRDSSCGAR